MIENKSKYIGNTCVIKAPDYNDGFTLYRVGDEPLDVGNHDEIEVVTLGRFSCFKCTDIVMEQEHISYVSKDGQFFSEGEIQKRQEDAAEAEEICERLMRATLESSTSSNSISTSNKKPASVTTGKFQPPKTRQLFLNLAVQVPA